MIWANALEAQSDMKMHTYRYRALTPDGAVVTGKARCQDEIELAQVLARQPLELIQASSMPEWWASPGRSDVPRQEMLDFCFQMTQLLEAGIPMLEGLGDLRDSAAHPRLREVIGDLHDRIQGGEALSSACLRHPEAFTAVMCNLLRAGEESGELPRVFARLHETLAWEDEIARQSKRLMLYPLFAGLVVLIAVLFLLLYLVPPLAGFVQKLSPKQPRLTQVVLNISNMLQNWGWLLLPILPGLALGFFSARARNPRLQAAWDRLKLRLWLLGPIHQQIALARFASLFGMLYGAGINILDTLQACEHACANRIIAQALATTRNRVLQGETLSQAFSAQLIFPPLVQRMIAIGETTGALERSMGQVQRYYEIAAHDRIARLQAMIEPSLTLLLGVLLGGVMYAVLAPLYEVIGQIRV